jgi:hypothetical protein
MEKNVMIYLFIGTISRNRSNLNSKLSKYIIGPGAADSFSTTANNCFTRRFESWICGIPWSKPFRST